MKPTSRHNDGALPNEDSFVRTLRKVGKTAVSPRLISLRQSNVANLVLADLDLRACRFDGVHNLDKLRIEHTEAFAHPPAGWRVQGRWPMLFRWTDRQVLAEEHEWRKAHENNAKRDGWYSSEAEAAQLANPRMLEASDIASLYRSLRKSREDSKDEPGAADFYYGEMEMRRAASSRFSGENAVLWLYWLFSGYGLRITRALAALLVTIGVFAVLFHVWGLAVPTPWPKSFLFSTGTATKLLGTPGASRQVTAWGEVMQLILRFAGPVFLGLAILSIRGRTKR
jgi:hypothetical protein